MSLALLTLSRLARIQDMLLPNVVLYLILNWRIFFALCLLAKRIYFALPSLKRILNLLSTNQSQRFSKSSLSLFSICTTSLCCYRIHESSAYNSSVDLTVVAYRECRSGTTGVLKLTPVVPCKKSFQSEKVFFFNIYKKYLFRKV